MKEEDKLKQLCLVWQEAVASCALSGGYVCHEGWARDMALDIKDLIDSRYELRQEFPAIAPTKGEEG